MGMNISYPRYIFPNSIMLNRKKVVLFGSGVVGKSYFNDWKFNYNIDIVMWIDTAAASTVLFGKEILKPENILKCNYDYVVCAVLDSALAENMKVQLMDYGAKENTILWEQPIDVFWNCFLNRNI